MTGKNTTARQAIALVAIMVATSALALLASSPAAAQFFPFWGPQQQQQPYYQERYREPAPVDYSKAPPAKKAEAPPTSSVVVLGDSMADWLAYGLEEAF